MKFFLRIFLRFILLLFTIALISYLPTVIYDFKDTKPFKGEIFYNPYQNLESNIYKLNFHAHTKAWKGVTHGKNNTKELLEAYYQNNYHFASISNYHSIDSTSKSINKNIFIPVYEHGFNILKSHLLVIDANKVSFFDFPLYQTIHHQQKVIDEVKNNASLIAAAHPEFGGGRKKENFAKLTGYHFVEVLNQYRNSAHFWDSALTSGKLVWGIGDDDTHDLIKEKPFRRYNMVFAKNGTKEEIIKSMKNGKHYFALSENTNDGFRLNFCKIENEKLNVKFNQVADTIFFIGDRGKKIKTIISDSLAEISLKQLENYVRIKAIKADKELYLNPIIRYDGTNIPFNYLNESKVNIVLTYGFRSILILLISLCIYFQFKF